MLLAISSIVGGALEAADLRSFLIGRGLVGMEVDGTVISARTRCLPNATAGLGFDDVRNIERLSDQDLTWSLSAKAIINSSRNSTL